MYATAFRLFSSYAARSTASKGIEEISKPFLNEIPDNKWQEKLERENKEPINEDPEKGRGRGDKGKQNRLENADNKKTTEPVQKKITEKGKQNFKDNILKEGPQDKQLEINEKGTGSFKDRLLEERGLTPEEGAKIEQIEPVTNFEVNEFASPTNSPEVEANSFFELASLDGQLNNFQNIQDLAPEVPNEALEFDDVSMDMDMDADGSDGGDGGGDGGE